MNTPKKVTLPTAVKQYSNIKAFSRHVTTGNFMEYSVARCKEMTKNQTYSFDMRTTARLKPMQSPTYGNVEIHNRAFFVPFRIVMPGYNDFRNDLPSFTSSGAPTSISYVHRISNHIFVVLFRKSQMSTALTGDEATSALANETYDFVRYESGNPVPYRFTPLGRYAYKVLRQLGYGIYFNGSVSTGTGPNTFFHSAMPLLCWMRIFFDWYFPSMYVDDVRANNLRKWFYQDAANVFGMSADNLLAVFQECRRVSYDTDYYTASWDNPAGPNNSSFSLLSMYDWTNPSTNPTIGTKSNGTPAVDINSNGGNAFTQYALDALKSLTDYMKRNQIAGARTLDRFIARWGSAPISEKILRSQYIAENISPIRIGDVTSTANSDGVPLGAYAGKGFGLSEKDNFVNYTAEEDGMLIVISTIVPEPIYYQGALRHTMHLNKLDFYTPEFDNKGVQALSSREVYTPTGTLVSSDVSGGIVFDDAVFGFVPRYSEYKVEHSQITGDLILGSLNTGMEGWTFGRDLTGYFVGSKYADVVHSQQFIDGTDAQQYDRIFDVFSDVEDKFIIEHQFRINNRFPGAPLYDGYEFDSEGKASNVSMDVNGVRAN